MSPDAAFTIEQVSKMFQVSEETIKKEINEGRLAALNIGGFTRIMLSNLEAYKAAVGITSSGKNSYKSTTAVRLNPTADFTHTWPDGKAEVFSDAREGIVSFAGKDYRLKLGFTVRKAAGQLRRRCLVLVDRYATVEFVASNEATTGQMASLIKDRDGKQLPVGAALPPEYAGVQIGPYRAVVSGAGASNGLAVICDQTDFQTMANHALIRYRFRKDRG
jgi:excisionase family DNA binding protein